MLVEFEGTALEFINNTIGNNYYCLSEVVYRNYIDMEVLSAEKTSNGWSIQIGDSTFLILEPATKKNYKRYQKKYRLKLQM